MRTRGMAGVRRRSGPWDRLPASVIDINDPALWWAPTEMPPPMWTTIRFSFRRGTAVCRVAFGNGFLVERMEDGAALYFRKACKAGYVMEFVNDYRVGNKGPAARICEATVRQQAAQVRGVFSAVAFSQVLEHQIIHNVRTRRNGFDQTAPSYDGGKIGKPEIIFGQFAQDGIFTEFVLLENARVRSQFFRTVPYGTDEYFCQAGV